MKRVALVILLCCSGPAQAETPVLPGEKKCLALMQTAGESLGDPTATISQARLQAAGAPVDDPRGRGRGGPPIGMPPRDMPASPPLHAHCEVFGKLQERAGANGQTYAIRFHMRLPTEWNGRFFFGGGGGSNGIIGSATGNLLGAQGTTALNLGYAVVTQDSGHDNALNNDPKLQGTAAFGWDAEARRNYGFASIGAVSKVAKSVIATYYGKRPVYSYFVGGSKGGQEAFMAVQRFGREFDGVLAGYPGFRLAIAGSAGEMWDDQAFASAAKAQGRMGADGLPLLGKSFTDADLALAQGAVLDACDALDGLKDGMVLAFARCTTARIQPALARVTCVGAKTDLCLAPAQVIALLRVYGGARSADSKLLYATWAWDAGLGGRSSRGYFHGWRDWKIGRYEAEANEARNIVLAVGTVSSVFTSPPTPLADTPTDYTRYALGLDVTASEAAAHVKWGSFGESGVDVMNATQTRLAPFTSHGGKLLIFHGVSDPVFSINDTIAWLEEVDRAEKGRAARFVRLFPVPGMNHGGGGPSTDQADFFSALVDWTEHGKAPEILVATARAETAWPGRTRPLCSWPKQAAYVGGDIERAASFTCR